MKLPKISSYWCTYSQSSPKTVMSRNRFELLLRFLHFNNNEETDKNDRLYKINKVVDALDQNFQTYYELDETVCVDKFLVSLLGRIIFRPFLKQKRHKYGIKIFKLCSGLEYTYKFWIYCGKRLNVQFNIYWYCDDHILHKSLCRQLVYQCRFSRATNCFQNSLVETIQKNRWGILEKIKLKKLKRGELIAKQNKKGTMILKWKDKQDNAFYKTFCRNFKYM